MAAGKQASRSVLAVIALLAMTLRALVPAGYMLAPQQTAGAIDLVLCSGQGQTHVKIDVDTGDVLTDAQTAPNSDDRDDPGASNASTPCVFAAAGTIAPPVLGLSLSTPLAAPLSDWAVSRAIAPGRGLAAPPPWATGPPRLA